MYWIGYWRMIIVDDLLPLNNNNDILLPCTFIPEASKEINRRVIEIWPFILAKAILKIASIMHCETSNTYDEVILHSLTGWHIMDKIKADGKLTN